MIVFVHQPEYIPWLGFFDKLARCDTFVIYDDAQFQHGGFHNRNRIRTKIGWDWLTVPIMHGYPQAIKGVKISGLEWINKQLNAITQCYEKTPFFKDYFPTLRDAISSNHKYLIELNLHLIETVAEILGLKVNMVRSSNFPYLGKEKNQKLVSICKYMGADMYLSGSGGKSYLNEAMFKEEKIAVQWHSYIHPVYKQKFDGFQPNMSIIDLLFNMGPEAKEIILRGGAVNSTAPKVTMAIPNALIIQQNSK